MANTRIYARTAWDGTVVVVSELAVSGLFAVTAVPVAGTPESTVVSTRAHALDIASARFDEADAGHGNPAPLAPHVLLRPAAT